MFNAFAVAVSGLKAPLVDDLWGLILTENVGDVQSIIEEQRILCAKKDCTITPIG